MSNFSKHILSNDLPELSELIKKHINNGIWFLFEDRKEKGKYLLYTGSNNKYVKGFFPDCDLFVLDEKGDIVAEEKGLERALDCRLVYFSDIEFPPSLSKLSQETKQKESKKYTFHVPKIYHEVWEVEAESEEEAKKQIFLAEDGEQSRATFIEDFCFDIYDSEHWITYPPKTEEKEFIVSKAEMHYSIFKIKAKTPEEAKEKAKNLNASDTEFVITEFSHELSEDEWAIEEFTEA